MPYKSHYAVGWNDLAHGILTWTPHEQWQSALEWALHCREIAVSCKQKGCSEAGREYYNGCLAAAEEYQQTGRISKR